MNLANAIAWHLSVSSQTPRLSFDTCRAGAVTHHLFSRAKTACGSAQSGHQALRETEPLHCPEAEETAEPDEGRKRSEAGQAPSC